jgi:hypothetical protein
VDQRAALDRARYGRSAFQPLKLHRGSALTVASIDPGKDVSGLALWGCRLLIWAGLGTPYTTDRGSAADATVTEAVMEIPEHYRGKSGSVAGDLIELAFAGGVLLGRLRPSKIATVRPAQWKGQTPKAIHHARFLEALAPSELAILDQYSGPAKHRKEVLDAIGLGLFYLGRIDRSGCPV